MDMRIRISYIPLAALAAMLVSGLGCGSARKPVSSYLPPKQSAPPSVQSKASTPAPATPQRAAVEPQKPSPTAPAPQAEMKPDAVQQLIAKAEAEYKIGTDQSLAGHSEEAKAHFDRAFNVLMSASADMRSDPRFQKEFDRVTEGVSTLEAAEQPAAEPVEQKADEEKSEPAPIDEANEVSNYPVDPNLKAKAAAEIKATHSDLPLMMTDQV